VDREKTGRVVLKGAVVAGSFQNGQISISWSKSKAKADCEGVKR